MMSRISFCFRISSYFFIYLFSRPKKNIDYIRFGDTYPRESSGIKSTVISLGSFIRRKKFFRVYDLLKDEFSKELFIKLLIFRILGPRHVKLPLNNDDFWKNYENIDKNFLDVLNTGNVGKFQINKYNFPGEKVEFHIKGSSLSILNTFILKQYHYEREGINIGVTNGDIVIDAGGCWGDTAVFFSEHAEGVYSFEFEENNLEVLNENLALNKSITNNVHIRNLALWDKSGETIRFETGGPGTSLLKQDGKKSESVKTITLDDFAKQENLAKVDFIKMDIEGAEGPALEGAKEIIIKYKPKLAISIYHSMKDFCNIPLWLSRLNDENNLGYKFYLDHFTIYNEETILFAKTSTGK